MTITIGTKTIKDANDANVAVKTLNDSTDSTASPLHGVLKGSTGAAIDPATEGNQVTANASLATIATNTTGAATAANQTTGNTSLATIATNTTGVATAASQATGNTALAAIQTAVEGTLTVAGTVGVSGTVAVSASSLPLPSGAATAANQSTTNTALGAVSDAAVTNPGSSASVIAALKGLLTLLAAPVLAAGSSIIGKVGIDQTTPGVSNAVAEAAPNIAPANATMQRPNDTTTYAAGDLVANDVDAADVTAFVIPVAWQNDLPGKLPKCRLQKSGTSTANAIFRVHIFGSNPAVANGDNGVFSPTSITGHRGSFDVTVNRSGGNGAVGYGIPTETPYIDFTPAAGTKNVYALIEARAAYAPAAQEVFTLEISTD